MNTVINIFQEQFNLIDNLPENEKEKVLYLLIQSKFNQVDCFEIQSRLSLSLSLSNLSLSVIDIISKTMRIKTINENHGGARKGSGAPKGNNNADKKQSKNNQKSIKLIESEKTIQKIKVPDYLLRSDSYDELTNLERWFYDNAELRPLLTQYWQGKTELYDQIGEIYLGLLTEKMKTKPTQKFIKPSLEEIKAFCSERKNSVDAEKFLNYYESNGWKVGKNPMKDWRASIRTWEKSDFNKPKRSIGFQEDNVNTFLKSKTEYSDEL